MFKLSIALLMLGLTAMADVPTSDFEFTFNRLSGVPAARKYQLGTKLREAHGTAICVYDYATLGGVKNTNIGLLSTDLQTACQLPAKAIIHNGFIDVTTAPVGSGALIALGSSLAGVDVLGGTGIASLPLGGHSILPAGTLASHIKVPTAAQPTITIGGANLTAGHFRVFLDYVLGE